MLASSEVMPEAADAPKPQALSVLEAVQALWGEGFVVPAEKRFAAELSAGLKLTKDKDIAILGASLCGMARELADSLNTKITCYDWDAPYLAAATSLNLRFKSGFLLKQVTLAPTEGFSAGRQYDVVLSLMRLHERADRAKIVKQCAAALKPGGKLCFVDYLSGPEPLTPEKRTQLFGARVTGPFWRTTDVQFALMSSGFKVDADLDVTAKFRDSIVAGFGQMKGVVLSVLKSQSPGAGGACEALSAEVKLWAARHDALRDGQLRVQCVIATRAAGPAKA